MLKINYILEDYFVIVKIIDVFEIRFKKKN